MDLKQVATQRVVPVLRDEVYAEVELVQACCAEITDKRQTSNILRELTTLYPFSKDSWLKRVKNDGLGLLVFNQGAQGSTPGGTQVLIMVQNSDSGPIDLEQIRSCLHNLAGLGELFVTPVPKEKPLTRKQFNSSTVHWPTHFYENKRLEEHLNGSRFSASELDKIEAFMREALAVAHSHDTVHTQHDSCTGAIIVDPVSNVVVARATNCPTHLLKHAVMVCIDEVASVQGGGVWGGGEAGSHDDGCGGSTAAILPQKRAKSGQQYLCSGYDLFTTVEPCVMCAMALVHARIGRVFYGCADEHGGALGSRYKIHTLQGVNHHFEVYGAVLELECQQLHFTEL
ncbi:hypothetical protein EMCRGX_G032616 [Ephydatia muelleri]